MDANDAPAQQIGPTAIDHFLKLPPILDALLDFMSPCRYAAPFDWSACRMVDLCQSNVVWPASTWSDRGALQVPALATMLLRPDLLVHAHDARSRACARMAALGGDGAETLIVRRPGL